MKEIQTVGETVSFPRQWVERIRDGLVAMGKLPSGPLGDWAFLFREQLTDALNKPLSPSPWRSLKDDPPGPEHRMLFVGNSEGGRRDYVFRWPHPKTGEITFWCKGEEVNYILEHFNPDVWHPGPPNIPGSWVDDLQKGKIQFKKPGFQ